jgi:hypothetical protein
MPQYNGVWTLEAQAQAQSNQQWVTDPDFRNVALLLQADNAANGATNNSFLDSSTNGFAITRNGNTTQGSFSPFSHAPGYWSNFFNGSNAYLTSPSNAAYQFNSGDFTVEMFVNFNSVTNAQFISIPVVGAIYFQYYASVLDFGNNSSSLSAAWSPVPYTWYHLVAVRSSATLTIYVNGKVLTSGSAFNVTATGTLQIGYGGAGHFNGFMSNLRFVKGTAVYTAPFTPPTTPLTAITNTSFLTCQSNRFVDNSTSALALTINGTPSVDSFGAFAPALQWTPDVVGGSGYFDGTGDYLILPSNAAFALGTGQFCIEAWHYPTQNSAGGIILSTRTSSINDAATFSLMQYTGTTYSMYANNNHVLATMTPFQWNHVIVTRDSSNTLRLILNGVLGNYEASYVENMTNQVLSIGALNNGGEALYGYTTGHRITKGSIPTAYQTASTTIGATIFTPPTQPVTLTSQGATSANVSYLSNYTNAAIFDAVMDSILETRNTAQVNTNVVKYGSGSMYFNNLTGDNLFFAATSKQLALGAADFTVELWIYPNSWGDNMVVIQGVASTGFGIQKYSSGATGNIGVIINGGWVITDAFLPIPGQWTHIAVTRANSILRFFVNGIVTGSTPVNTSNISDGIKNIAGEPGQTYFSGYMDDIRVTKGVARYIANFTPPQQALPRQ